VDRARLVDGRTIRAGDRLIGIPSSGLHTNGYSLARRIAFELGGLGVEDVVPELGGTIGEALLVPHRSYLRLIEPLLESGRIKGMAHITGGGITDNLPRVLPEGCQAVIERGSWSVPAVFRWLQRQGSVPEDDMLRTFNMGIGLIVVCAPEDAAQVMGDLARSGEPGCREIGTIEDGRRGVSYR
jgi:phosphoribosylformylglycinamidine cyclo-ligase